MASSGGTASGGMTSEKTSEGTASGETPEGTALGEALGETDSEETSKGTASKETLRGTTSEVSKEKVETPGDFESILKGPKNPEVLENSSKVRSS